MHTMDGQLQTLTTGGAWSRQPWDYNLIDYLKFQPDGTGTLAVGDGQEILGRAVFRYELTQRDVLSLIYVESPENRRGLIPWRIEAEETIELSFALRAGEFSGSMNMGTESGPLRYDLRWALDLDRAPYPAWLALPSLFFAREHRTGPWQTRSGHRATAAVTQSRQ